MGKCNLSVREQEGGAAGGVAEGLDVIWASEHYCICSRMDNYRCDGMTD